MSGGEASAPADATPPDFCARRSSLEVFPVCPRRFPLFALSLFLALLLVPSRSYAWDVQPKGVLYSTDLDGSRVGYVVSAYNQFDAACYAMGKDPNTISTEVKQKLSDSNYGGRFYDYAQSFFTQSGGLENVPTWVPAYVILISELGDLVLSDYQGVWYSTATKSLYDGALDDFVRVLNGEDLGGSEQLPEYAGDYYCFYANPPYQNVANGSSYLSSNGGRYTFCLGNSSMSVIGAPVTFRFPKAMMDNVFSSYPPSSYKYCLSIYIYDGAVNSAVLYVGNGTASYSSFNGSEYISSFAFTGGRKYVFYRQYFSYSASTNTITYGFSAFQTSPDSGRTTLSSNSNSMLFLNGFTTVVPPDGDWPEPEPIPTPTAPDLPEPVEPTVTPDPVVTEPTVTWPSPTITIDPAPVPGTTPTGLDYTELLTRINDNLISIDSFSRALNSNLNSLRSDLVNEFDGVVSGLRNVYTYLQHMDSVLERHCIHLQNKMEDVSVDIQNKIREMARWLAEQLDFDSESSGNSDLFGILSTINDKLGGGTYEPNPLKDENAYYEWLDDLWDRFLLGDNWQSSASSMSQSFGQLTSRFPFSVPWDIVALFRLFVHDPVTPVFDLPLYYSSEDSATVRVDLSAWDGVASVVRPLVFVIFALKLALLSRHLLAGFGADKGGL